MNFLACDGSWSVGASNEISCTGTLITITSQDMAAEFQPPPLTQEETTALIDATLMLFVIVFGFLVLKKTM